MENINFIKASIVTAIAGVTACLGWFGWLVTAFVVCMTVDWITGSAAAAKAGEWNSKKGREGLWHKTGSIIAVVAAAILDMVIGSIINNIPAVKLPFSYTVMLCPLVIVWYVLTELGSIVENAGKMGAPVPGFLKKMILLFKGTVDLAADDMLNKK